MNNRLLINSIEYELSDKKIIHNYIKSESSECIIEGKYVQIKIPNSTLNRPTKRKNKTDINYNKRLEKYYEKYKSAKLAQLKVAESVSSNEIHFSGEDKIYLSITFLFYRKNNIKFDLDNYIKKIVDGVALGLFETKDNITKKKCDIESIDSNNFEKLKNETSNVFKNNDYIIEKILAEKIIIKGKENCKEDKTKEGVIISLFKEN